MQIGEMMNLNGLAVYDSVTYTSVTCWLRFVEDAFGSRYLAIGHRRSAVYSLRAPGNPAGLFALARRFGPHRLKLWDRAGKLCA